MWFTYAEPCNPRKVLTRFFRQNQDLTRFLPYVVTRLRLGTARRRRIFLGVFYLLKWGNAKKSWFLNVCVKIKCFWEPRDRFKKPRKYFFQLRCVNTFENHVSIFSTMWVHSNYFENHSIFQLCKYIWVLSFIVLIIYFENHVSIFQLREYIWVLW